MKPDFLLWRQCAVRSRMTLNVTEEGVDFMFGDSLLVANVVEKGAKTRKVYLPEGIPSMIFIQELHIAADRPLNFL